MNDAVFIIAEAGVNHNGDIDIAKKLVDVAVDAGADAVKFQTFKAESLVNRSAPKADYQIRNTGNNKSQFEMLEALELKTEEFRGLYEYCNSRDIQFLSSPFDLESIDFLSDLNLSLFKIPSGEITNLPYLRKIGRLGSRVVLSTGMADLDEVRAAVDILTGEGMPLSNIDIMHCITEYPAPVQDVNLMAMATVKDAFPGIKVGYSDHTEGFEIALAAVAMGARLLEKHFTLDKNLEGPDHRISLDPLELKTMIKSIRNVEKALGDGEKRPTSSEIANRSVVRKSIVASRFIKKGDVFSESNITTKRPGTGISPMRWDEVVGVIAQHNFEEDEMVLL